MQELAHLTTESTNALTAGISSLSAVEILALINDQDSLVAPIVRSQIPTIAAAIDSIVPRLQNGGRVVYFGAGTSGRLGVLDASECLPTYNSEQFVGLMAGGDEALRKAKEGIEDSEKAGRDDLISINLDPQVDVAVGIASSGRTPYVIGGLRYARQLGCLTIGIACTEPSEMSTILHSDEQPVVMHSIAAVVGPEVVTGSTRMKAGTATKLILNMISTGCMIRLGKTYGNLMVDVRVSNVKLRARGHRLIRTVCKDTTLTDISLDNLIATCGGSVKLAIVVLHNQWTVEKGRTELDLAGGRLENVLVTKSASIVPQINCTKHAAPLFLCIDGGGTLTRAIITALDNAGRSTVLGKGFAGPSNISAVGIPAALSSISIAIQQATSTLPPIYTTTPHFSSAWIGCAGIDTEQRPSVAFDFTRAIAKLLSLDTKNLRVTSDAVLLGAIVSPGIILISGTGSIAMRFDASGAQVSRAGGLGYLLGDEGSGYDVGRLAIRHAIATPGNLRDAVMLHFHVDTPAELVNTVYAPAAQEETPKERISGVAPIVLDLAFCEAGDATSMKILHKAAKSLTSLIMQVLDPSSATHIASTGGLLKNDAFRFMLQETLESAGYVLPGGEIVHVQDPGEQTALVLAARGGVYS